MKPPCIRPYLPPRRFSRVLARAKFARREARAHYLRPGETERELTLLTLCCGTRKHKVQLEINAVQPEPMSFTGDKPLYDTSVVLLDALLGFWRRLTLPSAMRVSTMHDQPRHRERFNPFLALCYDTRKNTVQLEMNAVQPEPMSFTRENPLFDTDIFLLDALLEFWRRPTLPGGMHVPIMHDKARQREG